MYKLLYITHQILLQVTYKKDLYAAEGMLKGEA